MTPSFLLSFFLRPLFERRKFLHDNMVEVPNRILFSEMKHVTVSVLHTCTPLFKLKIVFCPIFLPVDQ